MTTAFMVVLYMCRLRATAFRNSCRGPFEKHLPVKSSRHQNRAGQINEGARDYAYGSLVF